MLSGSCRMIQLKKGLSEAYNGKGSIVGGQEPGFEYLPQSAVLQVDMFQCMQKIQGISGIERSVAEAFKPGVIFYSCMQ